MSYCANHFIFTCPFLSLVLLYPLSLLLYLRKVTLERISALCVPQSKDHTGDLTKLLERVIPGDMTMAFEGYISLIEDDTTFIVNQIEASCDIFLKEWE